MRNFQPQSISVATCSTIIRSEGRYGGHLKLHILEQNLYSWRDFLSFDPCTVCISITSRLINTLNRLVCTLHTLKVDRMKESGFTEEAGKNCVTNAVNLDHLLGAISDICKNVTCWETHPKSELEWPSEQCPRHAYMSKKPISRSTSPVITDWDDERSYYDTIWKLTGWKNLDLQRKLGKIEQSQTFAKTSHVEKLIPNLNSSDRVSNVLDMHTCQRTQKPISRSTPPVITDWEMMWEAIMTIVVEPQFRSPSEVHTLFWGAAGSLGSPAKLPSAQTPGLSSDWSSCCIERLRDEQ
jgi:hypothetical protein